MDSKFWPPVYPEYLYIFFMKSSKQTSLPQECQFSHYRYRYLPLEAHSLTSFFTKKCVSLKFKLCFENQTLIFFEVPVFLNSEPTLCGEKVQFTICQTPTHRRIYQCNVLQVWDGGSRSKTMKANLQSGNSRLQRNTVHLPHLARYGDEAKVAGVSHHLGGQLLVSLSILIKGFCCIQACPFFKYQAPIQYKVKRTKTAMQKCSNEYRYTNEVQAQGTKKSFVK